MNYQSSLGLHVQVIFCGVFQKLIPKEKSSSISYTTNNMGWFHGLCCIYIYAYNVVSDYVLLINITGKRKFMPNEYKIRVAREHALCSIFYFPCELRSIVHNSIMHFQYLLWYDCVMSIVLYNENCRSSFFYIKTIIKIELDWKCGVCPYSNERRFYYILI